MCNVDELNIPFLLVAEYIYANINGSEMQHKSKVSRMTVNSLFEMSTSAVINAVSMLSNGQNQFNISSVRMSGTVWEMSISLAIAIMFWIIRREISLLPLMIDQTTKQMHSVLSFPLGFTEWIIYECKCVCKACWYMNFIAQCPYDKTANEVSWGSFEIALWREAYWGNVSRRLKSGKTKVITRVGCGRYWSLPNEPKGSDAPR